MKTKLLFVFLLLVALAGLGTWMVLRGPLAAPVPHVSAAVPRSGVPSSPALEALPTPLPSPAPAQPLVPAPGTSAEEPGSPPPKERRSGPLRIPAGAPIPEIFPQQELREKIILLASSYDPTKIPEVARYLKHEEETVRDTARIGLIQIGDAKAVPYLQAAALRARSPEEAASLREAADFLALPSSSEAVAP